MDIAVIIQRQFLDGVESKMGTSPSSKAGVSAQVSVEGQDGAYFLHARLTYMSGTFAEVNVDVEATVTPGKILSWAKMVAERKGFRKRYSVGIKRT